MSFERNGGRGVNRQLPHLGNGGRGVNRQLPAIGNASGVLQRNKGDRIEWLSDWFSRLQSGMGDARIACGDWERVCSPLSMTRNGTCAVLLDPPYSTTEAVYAHDSSTVGHDVHKWCIDNGDNPLLRIALCGHVGDHEELEGLGWSVDTWDKSGGYQGADDRERIWFSPACVGDSKQLGLF